MAFVQRDAGGSIQAAFRWRLPGIAEEEIEEGAPELVAFKSPRPESERLEGRIQGDPVLRRLVAVLADETGKTTREILDAMKAKA